MCPRFPPSSLVFCLLPGERVLCFHGPLLYEAKVRYRAALTCVCVCVEVKPKYSLVIDACLWFLAFQCVKINIKDKLIKYFIHYSGWNKKWAYFAASFSSLPLSLVGLSVFLSNAEYLMFYLYWEGESCLLHPGLHKLRRYILGWISLDKFGDKVWIKVRLKEQIAIFCVLDHKEKRAGNLWASKATEDVQVCCFVTCHTEPWHFEVNCYHMAGPPYPLRWGWATLHLRLAFTKGFCHTKEWQMNGSV